MKMLIYLFCCNASIVTGCIAMKLSRPTFVKLVPAYTGTTLPDDQELASDWYVEGRSYAELDPMSGINRQHGLPEDLTKAHAYAAVGDGTRLISEHDVTTQDERGRTPLHYASAYGHLSCVKMLIERAPELVNIQDNRGQTALMAAAYSGSSALVDMLLSAGADVRVYDTTQRTVLHYACYYGRAYMVAKLLEKGLSPKSKDETGCTPLHYACAFWSLDMNHVAASGDSFASIYYLLVAAGAHIDESDAKGRTPLYCAVVAKNYPGCECLVGNGADVFASTNKGRTPLFAAFVEDDEFIALLMERVTDITIGDERGNTLMHHASMNNKVLLLGELMRKGAPLSAQNNQGATPLHQAIQGGHVNAMRLLIRAGASLELSDEFEQKPYHLLAKQDKRLFDEYCNSVFSREEHKKTLTLELSDGELSVSAYFAQWLFNTFENVVTDTSDETISVPGVTYSSCCALKALLPWLYRYVLSSKIKNEKVGEQCSQALSRELRERDVPELVGLLVAVEYLGQPIFSTLIACVLVEKLRAVHQDELGAPLIGELAHVPRWLKESILEKLALLV